MKIESESELQMGERQRLFALGVESVEEVFNRTHFHPALLIIKKIYAYGCYHARIQRDQKTKLVFPFDFFLCNRSSQTFSYLRFALDMFVCH